MNNCLTFSLSDKTPHQGVSESTAPLEAISVVMVVLISAFLFGFFKNPASKPKCGIIEVDAQQDSFIPVTTAITAQSVQFGFFKNPALKPKCGIIVIGERQNYFRPAVSAVTAQVLHGFFKNPTSNLVCGIIGLYRTQVIHHPIGHFQWDIFMGYAYATSYIIRYSYFEHMVFYQMLFFVAPAILIAYLSGFVPTKFVDTNECSYIRYYINRQPLRTVSRKEYAYDCQNHPSIRLQPERRAY